MINNIINDIKEEGGEYINDSASSGQADSTQTEDEPFYSDEELTDEPGMIPLDENGCRPGYIWKRMSGVGCVQENCSDAGGHYSYTQNCICSFVDSKPGDPTKACIRPANYASCSSCVYACIDPDSKCPDEK